MKKIFVVVALVASTSAVNARALSDQDINVMSGAAKAIDTYKKVGVGGLFGAVSECYEKVKAAKKPQGKAIEFCVALDVSGIFIDDSVSRANGFPRDPRFTDAEATNRVHGVLLQLGTSKSPADTMAYLSARVPRIQRYTVNGLQ